MHRIVTATSTLLSLCLAVACSPESGGTEGGFGDSADPDILPEDSTGPVDPSGADAGESDSAGSSSSGGDEEPAVEYPMCLDRDPALTGSLTFDFGAWGSPKTASSRHISADCFSTDFYWDFESHAGYVELRCTEGDLLDEKITATMDLGPAPFLEIPIGSKFHFVGGWVNDPTNAAPYQYFIIEDEVSHEVQVAALLNVVEGANHLLGALQLGLKYEMCPWVCEADCADGGTPVQRAALTVTHEQTGDSVEVLDGHTETLQFFETSFEVVAGRLMERRELGYSELDSAIVIASTPIY